MDDNTFECLSDESTILSSTILKHERLKRVTGKIFCQLLGFTQQKGIKEDEEKQKQSGAPPCHDSPISSHQPRPEPGPHDSEINPDSSSVKVRSSVLTQLDLEEEAQVQKVIGMKLLGDLGSDEAIMEDLDLGGMESPAKTLDVLELIMKKLVVEME